MEIAEHIDALRRQGDHLADAAERAGLAAAVPPCQPWLVKDLLRHTGYIHRWAARHITECPDTVLDGPPEADILRGGAADADLLAWFRAGHAALVQTLSTADPGLQCATFIDAPSPLAFWARRQAHETAIHRADADSALGVRPELRARLRRRRHRRADHGLRPAPQVPSVGRARRRHGRADDRYRPRLARGHRRRAASEARREPAAPDSAGPADCTVSGPASGLYLFLWNRSDPATAGVTITGDPAFLTGWQSSVRVRWN